MIIDVFLGLLGIGVISVLCREIRFQKSLSFLFVVLLGAGFWWFCRCLQLQITDNFSYPWLTSKYYPVKLDFFSEPAVYELALPFFALALLGAVFVISDGGERQKLYLCSLISLNLAALIMLISGQNTIQILVSTCFIDVLGFCLIDNVPARRQYIFYNLLADMGLFVSFAMLWGDCETNLLSKLPSCLKQGHDFALWLIVLAAVVKSGLFPFQGYLMPTALLSESRRNMLSFLSTPVSGFLILYKVRQFFPSDFGLPQILQTVAAASVVWGLFGALLIKNLAEKKLYFNLMCYGLGYAVLGHAEHALPPVLGLLFILNFLWSGSLSYTRKYFVGVLMTSLLLITGLVAAAGGCSDSLIVSGYKTAFVLAAGCVLPQLYSEGKENALPFCLLSAIGGGAVVFYLWPGITAEVYAWSGIFIILVLLRPWRLWRRFYANERLQSADGWAELLRCLFVVPVQFIGRILWLTIDFLIIERTLLSSLAESNRILARGYGYLHDSSARNIIVFLLCGLMIIGGCCWWGK